MNKFFPIFLFVGLVLTGCHSKSDKEMFDAAGEKAKNKNFSEAIKEFNMLAEEYPKSDLTCKGFFESAKIYHSLLIPNISREESLNKALGYYKKVMVEFENKPEAEQSFFMIGFLKANEFNQLDSAKVIYESFLKKYPKSQLVNSVQLELNNLGKTPEEILQNKTAQK
jgi:outer membrane protein assembly factor BamD (BamD/ComL family)